MDFKNLTEEELVRKLADLEDDLSEVTLEKTMIQKQTGLHINASQIMEKTKELSAKMHQLSTEIDAIKEEIKSRG
jgi:peptidoglycan hydrolase CwlO-like protein